uniref:C2H2-type domain-containing protein n=1 Tax=Timema douglasi TaxID=61478 RepID=A0A7R8VDM2_TIMDO|nr:unnamed protein product [Timema douglasi]
MLHILESVHTPTSEVDQRLEDSTRLVENQLTQLVLDGNSWVDTGQDVVTTSAWSDTREDNSTTTVTTQSFVNQPGSKVLDEDPDTIYYSEIINYLTAMTHRNGTSRRNKLAVKRRARNYCLIDDVLYYGHKNPKKVIIDKNEQKEILLKFHVDKNTAVELNTTSALANYATEAGAHQDAKGMFENIFTSLVFWKSLYVDICNYIKKCDLCANEIDHQRAEHLTASQRLNIEKKTLQEIPHKSKKAWQKVDVQVLGPFPRTINQSEYIVSIVDPITKWIVARPVSEDNIGSHIACFIFKTFCDFGFTKCSVSSLPPHLYTDIVNTFVECCRNMQKQFTLPGQSQTPGKIANLVSITEVVTDCEWVSQLFNSWVYENLSTWDIDLDRLLFEFRTTCIKNSPSPFFAMFGRKHMCWSGEDKENAAVRSDRLIVCKRRSLHSSVLQCRHCEELFTSKVSFRIHQRKHTEEARGRGVLEGEEPIGLTDATSRVTAHKRLTSLKSVRQRIKSRLDHVLERLKSKQNTTIKSSSKNGVDASLQAIAIAAVKRLLAETKYQRKSRGKYYKFSQEIHEEMAHHAMEHGILQSSRLFSERLGVKVSCSTIRNIVKSYRSYTPELKEEIGRYAAGFGVDAASRHFSARLNREVRQGLVRKFKNYYLSRYPDPTNKFDSKRKKGTNKKNLLDAKQKDDIGAHAVTAGVAATVKYFKEKQNICLREAVVRKLRKIHLDKNPVQVQDSILQCQLQREPMSNVQHSTDPSQALNIFQAPMTFLNSVQMGSRPSTMVFDQTFNPQIDPSNQLITLPHQNSSLSISSAAINNINNSTNTTSNFLPIHHQQVTSTTTSVIINQDNSFDQSAVQLPLYQHSQQLYSSFNIQGNTLENNLIPLNNNVANVTPVTLTINQQPLNHQPLSNQVSSQAAGSGVVLQTLNTMAPLTLEVLHPQTHNHLLQTPNNSSAVSFKTQTASPVISHTPHVETLCENMQPLISSPSINRPYKQINQNSNFLSNNMVDHQRHSNNLVQRHRSLNVITQKTVPEQITKKIISVLQPLQPPTVTSQTPELQYQSTPTFHELTTLPIDATGATLIADRDGTYTLATCLNTDDNKNIQNLKKCQTLLSQSRSSLNRKVKQNKKNVLLSVIPSSVYQTFSERTGTNVFSSSSLDKTNIHTCHGQEVSPGLQVVNEQTHHHQHQTKIFERTRSKGYSSIEEEEQSIDDPDSLSIYLGAESSSVQNSNIGKKSSPTKRGRPRLKKKTPPMQKRGRYTMYTPKIRAEMGRYAAVFGSAQACEHFKKILGHDVAESTIRGLRDKYLLMCGDLSNGSSKVKEVTSLDYNQRGRPMRLGKYDQVVQDCIHELSKTGEKLSSFLVITTAKQVLMQYEPELLEENGGNIKLTSTWAKSFLKRIGVQNHS